MSFNTVMAACDTGRQTIFYVGPFFEAHTYTTFIQVHAMQLVTDAFLNVLSMCSSPHRFFFPISGRNSRYILLVEEVLYMS